MECVGNIKILCEEGYCASIKINSFTKSKLYSSENESQIELHLQGNMKLEKGLHYCTQIGLSNYIRVCRFSGLPTLIGNEDDAV